MRSRHPRPISNGMKQSTKRFFSFAVAFTLLVAALIVYFNFIQPAYQEDQAVKAQMIGRQNFVDSQKAAIAQTKALIASYKDKGEGKLQEVVSLVLPLDPDLAGAFAQLDGIIQNNRLAAQGITVSIPVLQNLSSKAAGGQAAAIAAVKPFGSITFQVRVIGTYEDFKTLLKNLESNIRVFDVEKISFQPAGKPNQDLYVYDLTLNTYYQGQ